MWAFLAIGALLTTVPRVSLGDDEQGIITPDSPLWGALLHYRDGSSTIALRTPNAPQAEGTQFFLSPAGNRDPAAELAATIRAFQSAGTREKVSCRFPARYELLRHQLHLPPLECPAVREWEDAISAQRLSLVFVDGFLNNPASLFGHLFLRLYREEQSDLMLGYGVQYGAEPPGGDLFLYPLKGLAGWYDGFFTVQPFHRALQRYADVERRALWEFPISVKPESLRLLVFHLFELQQQPVPYRFVSQNCATGLQSLLAVLSLSPPGSPLRYSSSGFPLDLVKMLEARQLISAGQVHYYPSKDQEATAQLGRLSSEEKKLARCVARDSHCSLTAASLTPVRQAVVLDAAYALAALPGDFGKDRLLDLLQRRSQVAVASALPVSSPRELSPAERLGPRRLRVGYEQEGGRPGVAIDWRFGYQSLEDPGGDGSEINLFSGAVNGGKGEGSPLRVQELVPFRIRSFPRPGPQGFRPSWEAVAMVGEGRLSQQGRLMGISQIGVGGRFDLVDGIALFGLGTIRGEGRPGFGFEARPGWTLGGWLAPSSRVMITAELNRWLATDGLGAQMGGVVRWGASNALGAKVSRIPREGDQELRLEVFVSRYY